MLEKHHIIFKSQGGLDFPLNYEYLTAEEHRGDNSPHMKRSIDLQYKKELERKLREMLTDGSYAVVELINILGLKPKQAYKAFRQVQGSGSNMSKEDIIKRLMGGKYYL